MSVHQRRSVALQWTTGACKQFHDYFHTVPTNSSEAPRKKTRSLIIPNRVVHGLCGPAGWFGLGWVGNGSKICVFSGSEMTDVRKIHVVYIGNFVSSIDWQIRFVKTCGCLHCYDVH